MRRLPPCSGRNSYGAATMNDAGQGENASGSWQPDPTGRYKLRWRRSTGEWTDHVYGDDGALGNDPYGPPSPPIPPPPPDEPLAMRAPSPPRKGRRKLVIALVAIGVLCIVLAVIGYLARSDAETASEESPLTTTSAPLDATTTTTLSVNLRVQETYRLLDDAVRLLTVESPYPEHVLLGDRFEWCSYVETLWAADAVAYEAHQSALTALGRAEDAYNAATDDLDRAEAQQAIQDAREVLEMTEWAHTGGREALREDLALANPTLREAPQHSREVAYVRAWSAFMSAADPDTVTAVEDYGSALGATGDASELVYEADIANELAIWQEAISAAEDALDAALGRVVSGSVAYDAFRDSLRESCQGAP